MVVVRAIRYWAGCSATITANTATMTTSAARSLNGRDMPRLPNRQRRQGGAVHGVPLVRPDDDAKMRDADSGHGPFLPFERRPRGAEGKLLAYPLPVRAGAIVRQRDGQHVRP